MKRVLAMVLAAGLLLGASTRADAVDFRVKGLWLTGFSLGDGDLLKSFRRGKGWPDEPERENKEIFAARQRLRVQLDAVASEALSGTVLFEIGDQQWGKAEDGASLGTDGTDIIKVKRAYIDWMIPHTELWFRMGLQGVTLPNKAGGSAVFDTDVAGIAASYPFSERVALTALWMRPFNDNYEGGGWMFVPSRDGPNSLDNMDLFALTLPVKLDGFEITPWAMYGVRGRNS